MGGGVRGTDVKRRSAWNLYLSFIKAGFDYIDQISHLLARRSPVSL